MTDLHSIPSALLERAAADPSNASARKTLLKAAGRGSGARGHRDTAEAANGAQRASSAARGVRTRRGVPNQTEMRFAREVLDPMVARGELARYDYEGLTFFVYDSGSRCTPDWIGWTPDGTPVPFEVKAWKVHEATVLRMKLHAAARPWLRWRIYSRRDGAWRLHFDSQG